MNIIKHANKNTIFILTERTSAAAVMGLDPVSNNPSLQEVTMLRSINANLLIMHTFFPVCISHCEFSSNLTNHRNHLDFFWPVTATRLNFDQSALFNRSWIDQISTLALKQNYNCFKVGERLLCVFFLFEWMHSILLISSASQKFKYLRLCIDSYFLNSIAGRCFLKTELKEVIMCTWMDGGAGPQRLSVKLDGKSYHTWSLQWR